MVKIARQRDIVCKAKPSRLPHATADPREPTIGVHLRVIEDEGMCSSFREVARRSGNIRQEGGRNGSHTRKITVALT